MSYLVYLFTIIFSLACVFYTKYQLKDLSIPANPSGKWHIYGFIMRASFFLSLFFTYKWQDTVLAIVIGVWLFEIGINVVALKQAPLYVGKTSTLDKVFGKGKWIYLAVILAIAILIRVFNYHA